MARSGQRRIQVRSWQVSHQVTMISESMTTPLSPARRAPTDRRSLTGRNRTDRAEDRTNTEASANRRDTTARMPGDTHSADTCDTP